MRNEAQAEAAKRRYNAYRQANPRPDRGDGKRKPLVAIHPRTAKDFAKDAPVNRVRESNN